MKKTSMLLSLCVVAGLATRAVGQTPADAGQEAAEQTEAVKKSPTHDKGVEILRKVDAATKAVKLVSYKASLKATGWLVERVPEVEGTAVIAGECPDAQPLKFRYQAKFTVPDSDEVKEVTAGSDGDMSFLVDPSVKTVYEDIDPAVLGSDGRLASALGMIEYCHPTPFNDEINATHVEVKGMTKIGEENCHQIHVIYTAPGQEAMWYFSEKDFLPRRVDRLRTNRQGQKASTQLTLTNVVVDPKFKHDPFKAVVPEGFTKTDEFAPSRRRAPR